MNEQKYKGELECRPQMAFGWVVGAILIILAQRDLRKRPAEQVKGPVAVWRAAAMTPPGAVAYLIFGRRRSGVAPEAEPVTEVAD